MQPHLSKHPCLIYKLSINPRPWDIGIPNNLFTTVIMTPLFKDLHKDDGMNNSHSNKLQCLNILAKVFSFSSLSLRNAPSCSSNPVATGRDRGPMQGKRGWLGFLQDELCVTWSQHLVSFCIGHLQHKDTNAAHGGRPGCSASIPRPEAGCWRVREPNNTCPMAS